MVLRVTVLGFLILGALSLPLAADAAEDLKLKPGADGELCLSCHEALQQEMGRRSIHEPFLKQQCSRCHNPHASNHGDLLFIEPERVCFECHASVLPENTVSVHEIAATGRCTECHNPHSSENSRLLLSPGENLCFTCHREIQEDVEGSGVVHKPARESCFKCHRPHTSTEGPSLLAVKEPALCLGCHDPSALGFSEGHLEYPVSSTSCSTCHDPHGSDQSTLLKNNVHSPVAKRMCGQCHQGEPSADAVPKTGDNVEMCGECHKKILDGALESANVHWPVFDRTGCVQCHDPHASNQQRLLVEPMLELCGSCHPAVLDRQKRSKARHSPVLEGKCGACHQPHSSDNPYLLNAARDIDVCAKCHEYQKHSTHPIGDKVTDPRNPNITLDCSSCHRAHGTGYEHMFPFATYTFLCVQCHTDMRR